MTVIVSREAGDYWAQMASVWKLLALLAFVLMPFAMAAAPAAAHEAPTMAMAAGHCDDQPVPVHHDRQSVSDCSMCSALPAMAMPYGMPAELPVTMLARPLVLSAYGIIPEIVPPPPKRS